MIRIELDQEDLDHVLRRFREILTEREMNLVRAMGDANRMDDENRETSPPPAAAATGAALGWQVVEQFGHRTLRGQVREVQVAGTPFLEVRISKHEAPDEVRLISPRSVYGMQPAMEEDCRAHAEGPWTPDEEEDFDEDDRDDDLVDEDPEEGEHVMIPPSDPVEEEMGRALAQGDILAADAICASRCCKEHGCLFGRETCPVASGALPQSNPEPRCCEIPF